MHSTAYQESRQALRHGCLAKIEWSLINQSSTYVARILNFSGNGIYMETDQELKPGTTVWIRVDQRLSVAVTPDCSDCLPTVMVADTKWSRVLPETSICRYGMGLRYLFPMI